MQKIKSFFNDIKDRICGFFTHSRREKKDVSGVGDKTDVYETPEGGSTIVFKTDETAKVQKLSKNTGGAEPSIPTEQLKGKSRRFSASFKKRESRPFFLLGVVITTAKIAMIAVVIIGIACLGAVLGVANAYLGTTPELDLREIQDNDLTSYIYDCNGTLITSYAGVENRDYASLDEIPEILQQAFISIEDVRFYHHNGVDLKRLFGAFISNMSSGTGGGGSTITQQLIKNKLLTSERSYKRKIQEASLALQLENKYSKDQILEAYLNTIPLGGLNYGVKAAAKDYFGKELDELTLRETACIAGITQFPFAYNPRSVYYGTEDPDKLKSRKDKLDARIDKVLKSMYTAGYISLDEYNYALEDELSVIEESTVSKLYEHPHFVEYALDNVTSAFLEYRNMEDTTANRQAIKNELSTKGYNIYTTIDPSMQNVLEEAVVNYKYPKLKNSSDSTITKTINGAEVEVIQPQAAAVIIDQSTGQVKAMIGSRTPPTIKNSANLATSNFSQIGSSIKPLAVYGPALDAGLGLGTTIENIKVPIEGYDTKEGYPTTSHTNKSIGYGPVSIKNGIKYSLNIVAVRTLMEHVGVETAYEYMEKLVSDSSSLNKNPVGMALGSSGISTLDMTAAYAAIANGGVYNEPVAFTEVTDRYGETVLKSSDIQQSYSVYEKSTAYMLVSALTQAVQGGTGTNAKISGITVAGKTGTNAGNKGVFFAGMTGYYTSTVWIGHEYVKSLAKTSGGSGAAPLWQSYMSKILEGLEDKPILAGSASDYGVSEYRVCSVSGMLATDACEHDIAGYLPVNELYPSTAVLQPCTMHKALNICSVSGQAASEFCPATVTSTGSVVVLDPESEYLKLDRNALLDIFPSIIIASSVVVNPETGETSFGSEEMLSRDAAGNIVTSTLAACPIHTYDWYVNNQAVESALAVAQSAMNSYQDFINNYSIFLSDKDLYELAAYANNLQASMATTDADTIINNANALNAMVNAYKSSLDGANPEG